MESSPIETLKWYINPDVISSPDRRFSDMSSFVRWKIALLMLDLKDRPSEETEFLLEHAITGSRSFNGHVDVIKLSWKDAAIQKATMKEWLIAANNAIIQLSNTCVTYRAAVVDWNKNGEHASEADRMMWRIEFEELVVKEMRENIDLLIRKYRVGNPESERF